MAIPKPQVLFNELSALLSDHHPGEKAQNALKPYQRAESPNTKFPPSKAGVLVLLYPDGYDHWRVLLIQRAAYQGIHSQQISFPGGQFELGDADLRQTALREAREEVGFHPNQLKEVGWLTPLYIPVSHFQVYPLLALADEPPDLKPDNREVMDVLPIPVIRFREPKAFQKGVVTLTDGRIVKTPYFAVAGNCVWGATAMILNELLVLLANLKQPL